MFWVKSLSCIKVLQPSMRFGIPCPEIGDSQDINPISYVGKHIRMSFMKSDIQ